MPIDLGLIDGQAWGATHVDALEAAINGLEGGLSLVKRVVCTSTTRPAAAAGTVIYETDTKRTRIHDGTGWLVLDEPWQAFAPTLFQAVSVAYTTNVLRCRRSGSIGHVQVRITVTGTGTAANPVIVNLPWNALNTQLFANGTADVFDSSANFDYPAQVFVSAANAFDMRATNTSSADRRLGVASFTSALANNDIVLATFSYEVDNAARYS